MGKPSPSAPSLPLKHRVAATVSGVLSVLCLLALLVYGRSWSAAYACWVLSMAFSFLNMAIEPASLFRPFNLEETRRSAAAQSPVCAALSTLATVCMLLAAILWLLGS